MLELMMINSFQRGGGADKGEWKSRIQGERRWYPRRKEMELSWKGEVEENPRRVVRWLGRCRQGVAGSNAAKSTKQH
jgi:hypothetical protein